MVSSRSVVSPVLLALLCCVSSSADARGAEPARTKAPQRKRAEVVKEGEIRVVRGVNGVEPHLTTRAKNTRWLLIGALSGELRRLGGHRLKVWATAAGKKPLVPRLDVHRYEILDSGGKRPLVGRLVTDSERRLLLEQRDNVRVEVRGKASFVKRLRKRLGCKVWVVGELEAGVIKAYKFGWLDCKKRKPIIPPSERRPSK